MGDAYQKMVVRHWLSYQAHKHQLQDVGAIEDYMSDRTSDFEALIEQLEIAVATALDTEKATHQLSMFEQGKTQGVCFNGSLASWIEDQSPIYGTYRTTHLLTT